MGLDLSCLVASQRVSISISQHHLQLRRSRLCRAASYNVFDQGSSSYKQKRRKNLTQDGSDLCGQSMPSSLKTLKKQKSTRNSESIIGTSISKAFSSMVYMLKSMQRFSLEMLWNCEESHHNFNIQEIWALVQREMHASFVWLFQQVFACTPKLMLSVMVLLANFTVHSMDSSIVFAIPIVETSSVVSPTAVENTGLSLPVSVVENPDVQHSGDGGNSDKLLVAGGTDGDGSESFYLRRTGSMLRDEGNEDFSVLNLLSQSGVKQDDYVSIPKGLRRSLVAPVNVKIEPDNYECFDRTDLLYQEAMGSDSRNALILANYAQFLYLVRHNHDRAEKLFRLAKEADPSDGESLSRFASFLWLARGDKKGAEQEYKEAIATDPSNPFHVGDYANFLWHTGETNE